MPQMMPINWILMMIIFIIIFLMYNVKNYYLLKFNINNKNIINLKKKMINNWKW